uniref:Anti-Mullerian hormone n=2 Tax=Nothobranchius rachovii TaxID=451742 RepID=A0A1A8R3P1_9TELE
MHSAVMFLLFWSQFGAMLQLWGGLIQPHSSMVTANPAAAVPHRAPCILDDTVAMLREAVGEDGELTNNSLVLFGLCRTSSSSLLSELVEETRSNKREILKVLNPAAVLVSEEEDQEGIMLNFDLPQSFFLNPLLILAFETPLTVGNLEVTFSSRSLQPNTQSVCISEGTQYILLTGTPPEGSVEQKWRISAQTKSPDMKQTLKDLLTGGNSGNNILVTPLLPLTSEQGTDARQSHGSGQSSQTSFLCELRRFLADVLPQGHAEALLFKLDSLQSLPPLTLGPTSSETLLAGIINSSAPTIISFNSWSSNFPVHQQQLALSPALLEELRQKLENREMEIMELITQEKVPRRTAEKLERLKDLSGFQRKEPAADGGSQYHAFLLLKALQTVTHAYNMQKRLRATRADSSGSQGGSNCGLQSLTVSFERHLLSPQRANINNCQGLCSFPLQSNVVNHAVLLLQHTQSNGAGVRVPCCVPVAYDSLEVLGWDSVGSIFSIKPDIIAKECGCR